MKFQNLKKNDVNDDNKFYYFDHNSDNNNINHFNDNNVANRNLNYYGSPQNIENGLKNVTYSREQLLLQQQYLHNQNTYSLLNVRGINYEKNQLNHDRIINQSINDYNSNSVNSKNNNKNNYDNYNDNSIYNNHRNSNHYNNVNPIIKATKTESNQTYYDIERAEREKEKERGHSIYKCSSMSDLNSTNVGNKFDYNHHHHKNILRNNDHIHDNSNYNSINNDYDNNTNNNINDNSDSNGNDNNITDPNNSKIMNKTFDSVYYPISLPLSLPPSIPVQSPQKNFEVFYIVAQQTVIVGTYVI